MGKCASKQQLHHREFLHQQKYNWKDKSNGRATNVKRARSSISEQSIFLLIKNEVISFYQAIHIFQVQLFIDSDLVWMKKELSFLIEWPNEMRVVFSLDVVNVLTFDKLVVCNAILVTETSDSNEVFLLNNWISLKFDITVEFERCYISSSSKCLRMGSLIYPVLVTVRLRCRMQTNDD